MTSYFWIIVIVSAVAGIFLSRRWLRVFNARIAFATPYPNKIARAGDTAGVVAMLPALFFGGVLGSNLGGIIAASIANALAFEPTAMKIIIGIGVGVGVFCVLVFIVLSSAVAGATFMKVYLARNT